MTEGANSIPANDPAPFKSHLRSFMQLSILFHCLERNHLITRTHLYARETTELQCCGHGQPEQHWMFCYEIKGMGVGGSSLSLPPCFASPFRTDIGNQERWPQSSPSLLGAVGARPAPTSPSVLQGPRLRLLGHRWKPLVILDAIVHATCLQNYTVVVKIKWIWMSGRIRAKPQLFCSTNGAN